MKQLKKRLIMLALGLVLFCLTPTAQAYDWLPENIAQRTCSLTVTSRPGVTFRAYRVCEVNQWIEFTPTVDFAGMENITQMCSGGYWKQLLRDLPRYMLEKDIPAAATGVTDDRGRCTFDNLKPGIYLVMGGWRLDNGRVYRTEPFLISLPDWVKAGEPGNEHGNKDTWIYDAAASPKGTDAETPGKIRVLKNWVGATAQDYDSSVTVELWQIDPVTGTGRLYGTKALSRYNNWWDVWTDLEPGWKWEVRETRNGRTYAVSYNWEDECNIVITNRVFPETPPDNPKNDPDNPPDNPDNPDNPGYDPDPRPPVDPWQPVDPGQPGDPGRPVTPPEGPPNIPDEELDDPSTPLVRLPEDIEDWEPRNDPDEDEDIDDDDPPLARLPQTGVLWWPVPFLAMGGMFLFVLGWALNRRAGRDEE